MMQNIFVVDDSPTLCNLVSQMIRQLGGMAHSFWSAEACLARLSQQRPDLVLMDYEMPSMRGDQACRRLKATLRLTATPVVMMTAADDPPSVQEWHRAGADDVLPKPIRLPELQTKLAALTGPHQEELARLEQRFRTRVLLVHPDLSVRERVAGALEYAGFRVLQAAGESEVPRLLREKPLDALILGLGAPWSAALAVVKTAREEHRKQVLAITEPDLPAEPRAALISLGASTIERGSLGAEPLVQRLNYLLRRLHIDLRASERTPFFSVAQFREVGGAEWKSGYCSDLSPGGAFIRTLTPLSPSTELEMRLRIPEEREQQQLQGLVAWSRPHLTETGFSSPAGMGVRLSLLSAGRLARVRATSGEARCQAVN